MLSESLGIKHYSLFTSLNLQKRAVRAIANSGYREHTAPLFAKLGILDIFQVSGFQIAKFMFYYHKQLLPPMFFSLLSASSQIYSYDTRIAMMMMMMMMITSAQVVETSFTINIYFQNYPQVKYCGVSQKYMYG